MCDVVIKTFSANINKIYIRCMNFSRKILIRPEWKVQYGTLFFSAALHRNPLPVVGMASQVTLMWLLIWLVVVLAI